uniref:Uncharacterized protein n=1 Tax=Ciona intestinalis TaxID=7719 RepID=H2XU48_CIOIN
MTTYDDVMMTKNEKRRRHMPIGVQGNCNRVLQTERTKRSEWNTSSFRTSTESIQDLHFLLLFYLSTLFSS